MATTPQGWTNIPDAEAKIDLRDKNVPWYNPKLKKPGPSARELLENYSKIPPAEVEDHIYKMRDEAWDVFPYPCIGEFRFLDLAISLSPDYPAVLQRPKSGKENFLDLGCCVGQEPRKVAHDGAVQENLYGSDLRAEFFEMGYRLFLDRDTLKSKFIEADITDANSALSGLDGKTSSTLGQIEVCKRLVKLLREKKDSLILGRQVGNTDAGEYVQTTNESGIMYKHNAESFKKMWDEVGEETGTKWRVDYDFELFEWLSKEERDKAEPGIGMLRFSVFRE
ncbi:uncharacterized protein PAC_15259 [Phialocephala subalpina]|uniref:Methyltransferase domain-containing protein n=1 Tax=Phialocephala subalpina TaxID=576137 RepID=A0A1L7XJZ2_9HELO|nr:uncharacterized protein PAC_15259 [Phialocephala subalpina]